MTFHISKTFKTWGKVSKVGKTLPLPYANDKKIWPNIVYALVSLLATLFGQALRALALTCDDLLSDFVGDQICRQSKACFSPFGHPMQVNASQRKLSDVY